MKNEIVLNNVPGLAVHTTYNEREGSHPYTAASIHYHDEIEIFAVFKGGMRIVVDGKSYDAAEGEAIFVNSGIPHTSIITEFSTITGLIQFKEQNFIESDDSQILSYSSRLKSISEVAVGVIKNADVFASAVSIINESKNMATAYDMFIRSEIYRILGYLYREKYLVEAGNIRASHEAEKILPILSYINKNYNEDITLMRASAMLSFDPSYFCRIFKRATGASFTEYLNFVRISNAERLLTRSNKSILEISEATGFSSVSYFNRIFKKYKNCSPRYYRAAKHGENI